MGSAARRAGNRPLIARLSAKGYSWFWPKIAAALSSKHHWLILNCDSCGTVIDLDLRVKPRDPEVSLSAAGASAAFPACPSRAYRPLGKSKRARLPVPAEDGPTPVFHQRAFTDHSVNRHRASLSIQSATLPAIRGREFIGLINLLSE